VAKEAGETTVQPLSVPGIRIATGHHRYRVTSGSVRFSCQVERPCAASAEVIYHLLANVERWPEWLAGVRSATWEQPPPAGVGEGAVRRVVVSGLTMREQVRVAAPHRHHAYSILSGIPVIDHRADVRLIPDRTGTLITWTATFRPRIPLTGPLMWLMLRASMSTMARALARGAEAQPA
jgi:hypothetical protein